jgi:NAD+ kinase
MMTSAFNKIGLFIRKDDPVMEEAVIKVAEILREKSLTIYINEPHNCVPDVDVLSVSQFPHYCDLTIAIGGDGTMLSASRMLAGTNLSVVGINVGRLGFLADVTLAKLDHQMDEILAGNYREETRFLLEVSINHESAIVAKAMNDVVVHAHQGLHMIEFETSINGHFLNSQRADGLVIATPTGSTAYAMSAGGPILDVDLDAVVLASVSPHALSNRPLVVSASNTINITISETNDVTAMVTCDGRPGHVLKPGDTVSIRRHSQQIKLLHLANHDHYSILRAKLEWGKKLTC